MNAKQCSQLDSGYFGGVGAAADVESVFGGYGGGGYGGGGVKRMIKKSL